MNKFHLIVSSPDGHMLDDEATCLIVCGTEGELAVMAGHIPFVTTLAAGRCRVSFASGAVRSASVESGILSVSGESVVLLSGSFRWLD